VTSLWFIPSSQYSGRIFGYLFIVTYISFGFLFFQEKRIVLAKSYYLVELVTGVFCFNFNLFPISLVSVSSLLFNIHSHRHLEKK